MKTVLHLIETSGPGGAEKIFLSVIAGLNPERYRSVACLLREGWVAEQLRQLAVPTWVIPQRHSLDVDWIIHLARRLRSHGVDLMHAHEFGMNVYGSLLSVFTGIPIVMTVHGKNYYTQKLRRRLAYRFVAIQGQVVAVSEDLKTYLVNSVGIPGARITVLHNGINLEQFCVGRDQREQVRRELCVSDTQFLIGTVGNLYPVKGQTDLLNAAAKVLTRFPQTVFFLAGRGPLLADLQRETHILGIEKHIRFLGFREDVPALLAAADIFVLPSRSEGLSVSILEAMAAGKPVVATDVGGNRESIIEGQTGFLSRSGDAAALAEGLCRLLDHPDQIPSIGREGRRRVGDLFSVQKMVSNYEAVYETLTGCE
jgi:glycosyltransferase involved in cell wall biosynthesis